MDNGAENPDIVPFDDNEEEEEEEESDEEEESFGQAPGLALQGRGRGRGMMWGPNFPGVRGMRPFPRMPNFPLGGDGFPYGPGPGPDAFPMPDPFGMAPRPFMPYGPRYSGEFPGPTPGLMYHGRPQPGSVVPGGGFGMMGPGRVPFMQGMGPGSMGGRAGRPMGMPPMFPPQPGQPQAANRGPKRDQREPGNEWGETYGPGPEQGKVQDDPQHQQAVKSQTDDKYSSGKNVGNDDSESEDEAPRRSRHGEGKKKRRDVDGDVHGSD